MMNRRGLTLLEMMLATSITAVIATAIASMMAAATDSLSSRDDGRQSAIRLATMQVRLGAYIAPSCCLLDKGNEQIILWFEDSRESNTVHASEIRWIQFNELDNELIVKFVVFPQEWSQSMVDAADLECNSLTDYDVLLDSFEANNLIDSFPLVDSITACTFWTNTQSPIEATQISTRFTLANEFEQTSDSLIDETIRLHQPPSEQ